MTRFLTTLAVLAAFISGIAAGTASATTLDYDVRPATPGGTQQIYHLMNGNYLGLWGISGNASDGDMFTSAHLREDFGVGEPNIVGFYYGTPLAPGAWDGAPAEFTPFGAMVKIDMVHSAGKLFDSFWVEWTGGNLFNLAHNSHMPASATLNGDPLAQVPEPATIALFGLGLAGLGFARRRKPA